MADSHSTTGYLHLSLDGNPLHCDERMTWIKIGQEEGWIEFDDSYSPPECENYPGVPWNNITLPGNTSGKTSGLFLSQIDLFYFTLLRLLQVNQIDQQFIVVSCPSGTLRNLGTLSCDDCGFGSYQNVSNQCFCYPCPSGFTTITTTATQQDQCLGTL